MAKFTFYKYNENSAEVFKVASGTSAMATHTLISISTDGNYTVTVKTTTARPAVGDILVWRPYPTNSIYGDRYGRTTTPSATGTGEVYGFKLKAGDKLICEDIGGMTGGIAVGDLIEL